MANTVVVSFVRNERQQFTGLFSEMWLVKGTWSDSDAIADDVSVTVTMTVPGVALGDVIPFPPTFNVSQLSTGSIVADAYVSAADTVSVKLTNIDETTDAFADNALTNATMKFIVGRPTW